MRKLQAPFGAESVMKRQLVVAAVTLAPAKFMVDTVILVKRDLRCAFAIAMHAVSQGPNAFAHAGAPMIYG